MGYVISAHCAFSTPHIWSSYAKTGGLLCLAIGPQAFSPPSSFSSYFPFFSFCLLLGLLSAPVSGLFPDASEPLHEKLKVYLEDVR